MKYICALALLISGVSTSGTLDDILDSLEARTQQQTITNSDVEVVELMRVETAEDLQAQLTDGYPMPWLEEIFNDESIPEEDRYWLDCRIRAAIAQDLHLFFDREGNPIHVEADWIGPGEEYWREHMMVNPPDAPEIPDVEHQDSNATEESGLIVVVDDYDDEPEVFDSSRPTPHVAGEPGYILDLYGNRVGELATVHSFVSLSRDASIAAIQSGCTEMVDILPPLASYACLMYPDGSFREIPFESKGYYNAVVSENGEVVVFECTHPTGIHDPETYERTGVTGDIYFFDSEGNLLNSVAPPSIIQGGGKLSSTGRYFCT
ncbi:MAG: hypothetical protein GF388_07770, partial [Candidatus Aegiribacteria sp.]|nr:hypothetical protein [Candidatus Aegiribacteria sp.]